MGECDDNVGEFVCNEAIGFEKAPSGMMLWGESGDDAGDLSSADVDSTVDTVVVGEEFVDEVAEFDDRLSFF